VSHVSRIRRLASVINAMDPDQPFYHCVLGNLGFTGGLLNFRKISDE
jgi:hypothetical protein